MSCTAKVRDISKSIKNETFYYNKMNSSQLECMIDCDPVLRTRVTGVYAADQLPIRAIKPPYGFIANTQSHVLPGEHWCAFYDDGLGHILFFDSYGRLPRDNSVFFQKWLNGKIKTVRMTRTQIQNDDSAVCGLYCIMFLRKVLAGHTLEEFVNLFDSTYTSANDSYVSRIISRAYSECRSQENGQNCTTLRKREQP